jgi:hypothetical protein
MKSGADVLPMYMGYEGFAVSSGPTCLVGTFCIGLSSSIGLIVELGDLVDWFLASPLEQSSIITFHTPAYNHISSDHIL